MKLSDTRRNRKAELEGEWNDAPELGFKADGKPVRLLTRSINYPDFKIDLQQTEQRLAQRYGAAVPPEVLDVENGRLYATHLLLGWDGIDDPFTPELALEEMQRPEARDLRECTVACARLVGKRRAEHVKAVAGNLDAGSASS